MAVSVRKTRTAADLAAILGSADQNRGFALLQRATSSELEILAGPVRKLNSLTDIPVNAATSRPVLVLIPFRQIAERGLVCIDDHVPIRCIVADEYFALPVAQLGSAPRSIVRLGGLHFAEPDSIYASLVRQVINDEIGHGAGSNFVIRRDLLGQVSYSYPSDRAAHAFEVWRRMLDTAHGAYWRFGVQFPDLTLIGASPERHLALRGPVVEMTPMSGTFRYPVKGDVLPALRAFLYNRKEIEELDMVVDEELKMMTKACAAGVTLRGPFLRMMDQLAHTEYWLSGLTVKPQVDVLRDSMFAPTVTGSPLVNAFRVIARHENSGRGYYSGIIGLLTADPDGTPVLDSAIVIRTAAITADGQLTLSVGATLVRDSKPDDEVLEIHAKAAGLLSVLSSSHAHMPSTPNPVVASLKQSAVAELTAQALASRNVARSDFWLGRDSTAPLTYFRGQRALVVNMEDDWTQALAYILRQLGLNVTEVGWQDAIVRYPGGTGPFELLVAGPGPGDPNQMDEPRISAMMKVLRHRTQARLPLLAVCLSHQLLCQIYGFSVRRLNPPQQGLPRNIIIAGRDARVGFYNSFAAVLHDHRPTPPGLEIWFDADSREIHGLRSDHVLSFQFHIESVLSKDGVALLRDLLPAVLEPPIELPDPQLSLPRSRRNSRLSAPVPLQQPSHPRCPIPSPPAAIAASDRRNARRSGTRAV